MAKKRVCAAVHQLLPAALIAVSLTAVSLAITEHASAASDEPRAANSYDELMQLGQQQIRSNNLEYALKIFEAAIGKANKNDDKLKIATALHNIGVAYGIRGDLAHSKDALSKSLKLYKEIGNVIGMARVHGALGIVYRRLGDYAHSIENYRTALSLSEQVGDKENMALTASNLGIVYVNAKDLPHAEEMFLRSLRYSKQMGSKGGVALAHSNLGSLYLQQGNRPKACTHWTSARNLLTELRSQQGVQSLEASMAQAKCTEN